MAQYKYVHFLQRADDPRFDTVLHPSTRAPRSGIYMCQRCGAEILCLLDEPLPDQHHHRHGLSPSGDNSWRLVVATT